LNAAAIAAGVAWASLDQVVCALRFFYGVTVGQETIPERIVDARAPRKLPTIAKVARRAA
jgi:hypothetical protein